MTRISITCLALCGTSLLSLAASPAWADEAEGASTNTGIQEIVVTAQKREQSLNRVGLTVAALTGDALKDRQITNLQDLAQAVPSMTFANSPTGTPVISIRGVGFLENSIGAYPTVSLYLDQVGYTFPVLAAHVNFDIERVEVLKGPQGTLFGQNATGGAINFIAAKPTDDFHAGITLGYGRFNAVTEEGYISGPISSTLSARFSQRVEYADGWQKSATRPDDRNGKLNNIMGRLQLDFHPSDAVNFLLNVNGWKDRSDAQAAQYIGRNLQVSTGLGPDLAAAQFSEETPRAADWNEGIQKRDNRLYQISLRGDIELGADLTLTTLTAYTDYDQKQAEDFDGLPFSVDDFGFDNGTVSSFSQELRISNGERNKFRWMIGGNIEDSKVTQQFNFLYDKATTGVAFGIRSNLFGATQKTTSYSGFGNIEYDIFETITLKGGIRYTDYKTNNRSCGTDVLPPFIVGNLFYDFFAGGLSGPYTPGRCFPINDLGTTINGILPGQPGEFVGSLKDNNVSWRVGVDWKVTPDALLYVNVAKGYKAGNFSTNGASAFKQYLAVKQESLLSYEAGFKVSLLDRRLQINAAGFYYDYKDKQLRARINDPFFGALEVVKNIPKSSIKGAEIDITAQPFRGLTLNASATYIEAKIDRFTGINSAGVEADFAGTEMPFTPKFQANFSGDYVLPVSQSTDVFAGFTVAHRSSTIATVGGRQNSPNAIPVGLPLFRIDAYTLLDLRMGVKTGDWKLSIWGKNVTNKYYWNNVNPSFDAIVRYAGPPATYGVTVGYNF